MKVERILDILISEAQSLVHQLDGHAACHDARNHLASVTAAKGVIIRMTTGDNDNANSMANAQSNAAAE